MNENPIRRINIFKRREAQTNPDAERQLILLSQQMFPLMLTHGLTYSEKRDDGFSKNTTFLYLRDRQGKLLHITWQETFKIFGQNLNRTEFKAWAKEEMHTAGIMVIEDFWSEKDEEKRAKPDIFLDLGLDRKPINSSTPLINRFFSAIPDRKQAILEFNDKAKNLGGVEREINGSLFRLAWAKDMMMPTRQIML